MDETTHPAGVVLHRLALLCGGPEAVTALDDRPLADPPDLPLVEPPADRQRLEAVAELLDALAARCFDAEAGTALRRALVRVWGLEPLVVVGPRRATHVAAGVCGAVGAANGLVGGRGGPRGGVRQGDLRALLGVTQALAVHAAPVVATLRGFWPWADPSPVVARSWRRQWGLPELVALGYADLLTSDVRARLVRVRDEALAARVDA